jgi:hypothetical protein
MTAGMDRQVCAFVLAVGIAGGVACSSPAPTGPRPQAWPDAPEPGSGSGTGTATAGVRGQACTPEETDPAGTCGDGLLCMPQAPGGYCLSFCGPVGGPCERGAVCTESIRGGTMCLAGCASDADCRTDEGYSCDPTWKACALTGLLAPRAPTCDGAAVPSRATFARAESMSSSAGPGIYNYEPSVVVLPDGGLVALYAGGERMGAPNALGIARIGGDGSRTFDQKLTSDRENHFDPWLAIDRTGTVHAVWMGFDGGRAPERNMTIAYTQSPDGGKTWAVPRSAVDVEADCPGSTPGCVDKPMIAIGRDVGGAGEVIYVAYASTVTEAMRVVASRDGGATWTRSVTAHPGTYGDLEVDPSGTLHVVAVDGGPGAELTTTANKVTYAASYDGGKTFSPPVAVSAEGEAIPFFFSNPTLAIEAGGKGKPAKRLHVVYPTGTPDGAWDVMLATSTDRGKTWSRVKVNDDERCASHMVPQAVLDPKTKKIHVTWYDSRGGGRLAYAVCAAGGATCGRTESVSDKPFAAYSYVRHGATWLGEYYGLVLDPKRRILHAVWTQPVREGSQVISRILHAQTKL